MKNIEITVILYNLRSVYNTASIFRTADALGVEKIYPVVENGLRSLNNFLV